MMPGGHMLLHLEKILPNWPSSPSSRFLNRPKPNPPGKYAKASVLLFKVLMLQIMSLHVFVPNEYLILPTSVIFPP